MSLRVKLFGAFFTLVLVPLAVLGVALHLVMTGLLEDKFARQTELTLRALSQNVGFLFSEMNKVTDSTIASRAIQELLDNVGPADLEAHNYMQLNEVQKNFRELLVNHPSINNAVLYTLDNEAVNRIFAKELFDAPPFHAFRELPVFANVVERDGLPYWVGPYEYPELTGREPVFTQIRIVKDIDTLENKGILLVQIKPSGLEAVFRYFRYRQEQYATRFFIVNGRGMVLYDSGGEYSGLSFGDYAEHGRPGGGGGFAVDGSWFGAGGRYAGAAAGGFESGRMRFAGEDSIVSRIPVGLEDWQLVAVTDRQAVSDEARRYAGWTAAVVGFCLLLACLFLLFFGNRVAKAITDTVHFMRRVERGDLSARLPVAGNDETALLARGFNSLVHRIAELLDEVKRQQERKREAELQALQAQIKPHFLFNTLESINGLAAQNQGRKVNRMVARLGNLLRISILQNEEITVEQELEHLRSYLEIQHYRFEGLFAYEIDVPPGLLACFMPKLTLQPLVENCIQHGFEGIPYMGRIRVSAREDGPDRIAFFVEDNGIGIPPGRLAALARAMEGGTQLPPADAGPPADRGERRGLGLANVAVRLRIRYGRPYGLVLCSQEGAGTIVKMTIPRRETELPADAPAAEAATATMKRGGTDEAERLAGG